MVHVGKYKRFTHLKTYTQFTDKEEFKQNYVASRRSTFEILWIQTLAIGADGKYWK